MTATTKFKTNAAVNSDSHEPDSTNPTLVGIEGRRKRAAGGTGVLLRDVVINVSHQTLVRVDAVARAMREISPATMKHEIYDTPSRGTLTRIRLSETLYTLCFVHSTKLCILYKGSVCRDSEREEVAAL